MDKLLLIGLCLCLFSAPVFSKQRTELDPTTKNQLIKVLKLNEEVHAAFFKYDGKLLKEKASKMASAIDKIEDPKIKKLLMFSKEKLEGLKESGDREENNRDYNLISMALIYLVNKFDVGDNYKAYSCPMVKKKWVQNTAMMEKVHNPYAPEMPHCGSLE